MPEQSSQNDTEPDLELGLADVPVGHPAAVVVNQSAGHSTFRSPARLNRLVNQSLDVFRGVNRNKSRQNQSSIEEHDDAVSSMSADGGFQGVQSRYKHSHSYRSNF